MKRPAIKHKILGLFSVVRGYNLILLIIAQYLASVFVFAVEQTLQEVLYNLHLHLIVLATICVVSAGYIINDFYDASIDAINKPIKTQIGNWVSQKIKLQAYFVLNLMGFVFSVLISWKSGVFFATYIFLIWVHSHKIQKFPLARILSISILDMLPFFVILVFYNHISTLILMHGAYLYLLMLLKEIIKDFERAKGAILTNTDTLILKYGDKTVKVIACFLASLMLIPAYYLLRLPEVGLMRYYFYATWLWQPIFIFFTLKAKMDRHYLLLHNFLRMILVTGVFSLSLIDTSVLIVRLLNEVKI